MSAPTATANTNPEFDKLKGVALQIMSQKLWSGASLVELGGSLAVEVNRLTTLSGPQKKQLVLDVIRQVLQESVKKAIDVSGSPLASAEMVSSLNFVLDHALPASLDLAVAAARGQIDLKKPEVVEAVAYSGCMSCLPFALGLFGVSRDQAQQIVGAIDSVVPDSAKGQKLSLPSTSDKNQTAQLKNSHAVGVELRAPQATPQNDPQKASVA